MNRDTNNVAIVTGASRGIGAAIAERLAADGFTVVVNYAGSAADAEALVAKIEAAGGTAIAAQADVSDANAVARMFDAAQTAFGGVDVLVNNAGIMKVAPLADSDDALFDSQVAVNLKGSFNTLREASRRLREGGRIINLSSSVVGLYHPNYAVYAATKAGVEAMTHVIAKEMRGRNITVNAVAPGPTATAHQARPTGAAWPARGHRRGRRVPGRPRWGLDQRSGPARQRRDHLKSSSTGGGNDRP
jgi:3-oxoacyl-[acyl-carrier protein] reductase